jgi:hypothetical protein
MTTCTAAEVLASSTAAMLVGVRADLLALDVPAPQGTPCADAAERASMLHRIDGLLAALHGAPVAAGPSHRGE